MPWERRRVAVRAHRGRPNFAPLQGAGGCLPLQLPPPPPAPPPPPSRKKRGSCPTRNPIPPSNQPKTSIEASTLDQRATPSAPLPSHSPPPHLCALSTPPPTPRPQRTRGSPPPHHPPPLPCGHPSPPRTPPKLPLNRLTNPTYYHPHKHHPPSSRSLGPFSPPSPSTPPPPPPPSPPPLSPSSPAHPSPPNETTSPPLSSPSPLVPRATFGKTACLRAPPGALSPSRRPRGFADRSHR